MNERQNSNMYSAGLFGQPAPQNQEQGRYGNPYPPNPMYSSFGSYSQQPVSNIKVPHSTPTTNKELYKPYVIRDSQLGMVEGVSISNLPSYNSYSVEELRAADYKNGRKTTVNIGLGGELGMGSSHLAQKPQQGFSTSYQPGYMGPSSSFGAPPSAPQSSFFFPKTEQSSAFNAFSQPKYGAQSYNQAAGAFNPAASAANTAGAPFGQQPLSSYPGFGGQTQSSSFGSQNSLGAQTPAQYQPNSSSMLPQPNQTSGTGAFGSMRGSGLFGQQQPAQQNLFGQNSNLGPGQSMLPSTAQSGTSFGNTGFGGSSLGNSLGGSGLGQVGQNLSLAQNSAGSPFGSTSSFLRPGTGAAQTAAPFGTASQPAQSASQGSGFGGAFSLAGGQPSNSFLGGSQNAAANTSSPFGQLGTSSLSFGQAAGANSTSTGIQSLSQQNPPQFGTTSMLGQFNAGEQKAAGSSPFGAASSLGQTAGIGSGLSTGDSKPFSFSAASTGAQSLFGAGAQSNAQQKPLPFSFPSAAAQPSSGVGSTAGASSMFPATESGAGRGSNLLFGQNSSASLMSKSGGTATGAEAEIKKKNDPYLISALNFKECDEYEKRSEIETPNIIFASNPKAKIRFKSSAPFRSASGEAASREKKSKSIALAEELGQYYTAPPVDELKKLKSRKVSGLVLGRYGYGRIEFKAEIDLDEVDLDRLGKDVRIERGYVSMYVDKDVKVGKGFNKPARIVLEDVFAFSRSTGLRIVGKKEAFPHKEMQDYILDRATGNGRAKIISYNYETGLLDMECDHF